MIEKLKLGEGLFFLTVYALAAISGGLGGAVVWSYYARHGKRAFAFILSYSIIGLVFGVVSAALMLLFYDWRFHEVILYSIASGFGGTTAIFGINWGAGVALRWRNFEVKFTVRRPQQERRGRQQKEEDWHD